MNYKLKTETSEQKGVFSAGFSRLAPLLAGENRNMIISFIAVFINSAVTLYAPILISEIVDKYISKGNLHGLLVFSGILLVIYIIGVISNYIQMVVMGGIGRRMLFNLRNALFNKLQELPVAFFDQNKAGDLISRINNDTDKLNQFFSQALMQFVNNIILIAGAGVFLVVLNVRLGLSALLPALGVLIVTQVLSNWVKDKLQEFADFGKHERRNTGKLSTISK